MPNSFWLKNKKLIIDTSGHPILCDRCPCGACPDIPAGSCVEVEYTRTITRTNSYSYAIYLDDTTRVLESYSSRISVSFSESVSMAYVLQEAIPFRRPYGRDYPDGYVRLQVPEGAWSRAATGTAEAEYNEYGNLFSVTGEPYALLYDTSTSKIVPIIDLLRGNVDGSCSWILGDGDYKADLLGDTVQYIAGHGPMGSGIQDEYEWRMVSGSGTSYRTDALLASRFPSPYGTFERTASGLVVPLGGNDYGFKPDITFSTESPWSGSASASVKIDAEGSYFLQGGGMYGNGERRDGAEHLEYAMTCHWLITPPTPLGCANCGL